jgi:hypothetical protein
MSQVTCLSCKRHLTATEFVTACRSWSADIDCVIFHCPHCQSPSEVQLENGRITHGYIYAAGSPHFSPQFPELLSALVVEQSADGLKVTLDDASRTIPRAAATQPHP